MSSLIQPNIVSYRAGAAIAYGVACKPGADGQHVVKAGAAATDKAIGINQSTDATAAEDTVELAVIGGGAEAKAGGTIAMGDELGFDTDGKLVKVASASDRVIAIALEAAVLNDLFSVMVVAHKAVGTQA